MSAPQAAWPAPGVYSPDQGQPRQLWQPNEADQLRAVETLMKGPIPSDLRDVLRSFHTTLDQRSSA